MFVVWVRFVYLHVCLAQTGYVVVPGGRQFNLTVSVFEYLYGEYVVSQLLTSDQFNSNLFVAAQMSAESGSWEELN